MKARGRLRRAGGLLVFARSTHARASREPRCCLGRLPQLPQGLPYQAIDAEEFEELKESLAQVTGGQKKGLAKDKLQSCML